MELLRPFTVKAHVAKSLASSMEKGQLSCFTVERNSFIQFHAELCLAQVEEVFEARTSLSKLQHKEFMSDIQAGNTLLLFKRLILN